MSDKSKKSPVILSYFAQNQEEPYLTMLDEELSGMQTAWEGYQKSSYNSIEIEYLFRNKTRSTRKQIEEDIEKYGERIILLQFSGHAGSDQLLFSDGEGGIDGLAGLLKLGASNLKLIVLNGCSTYQHVETFFQRGVPVIIATSCDVRDTHAMKFGVSFHLALSRGKSIEEAYQQAIFALRLYCLDKKIKIAPKLSEDAVSRSMLDTSGKSGILWGLFFQDTEKAGVYDSPWWKLKANTQRVFSKEKEIGLRKDMAYTCNRTVFSFIFDDYQLAIKHTRKLQHYLIVGPMRYSPVGLARKLAYEKFTQFDGTHYYYRDKIIEVEVGLASEVDILRKICQIILPEDKRPKVSLPQPLTEEQSKAYLDELYQNLIEFLNEHPHGAILCLEITYDWKQANIPGVRYADFVKAIHEFIQAFNQKESIAKTSIIFFWSVIYYGESLFQRIFSNNTEKLIYQFTQGINVSEEPAGCQLLPITKPGKILDRLSKTDIDRWFERLKNRENLVDPEIKQAIYKEKSVSEIEGKFLKIINDLNYTLLKD